MKYAVALIGAAVISVGCEDFLTTNSSTDMPTDMAGSSTGQLQQVLTATYKQFLFNSNTTDSGDRVYAGIPGLQMYYDLRGADIMSHSNMGGSQCSSYNFDRDNTSSTGSYTKALWGFGYHTINLCNFIIDSAETADGSEAEKALLVGQAKAMRAVAYFQLIINYQKTYAIAKDKRGVILRLHKDDPEAMGFSTVEQVYTQILTDLNEANTLLADYEADQPWKINTEVIDGWLARVYLVMENWQKAYDHASKVYANHSTLMTKEQWYSGFDDVISGGYDEVVWAIAYTTDDNLGGGTQYNFWDNQDPDTYGEGQKGIYRFFNFYVSKEYVNLFDDGDWRGTKIPKGEKMTMIKQKTKKVDGETLKLWLDADGKEIADADGKDDETGADLEPSYFLLQKTKIDDKGTPDKKADDVEIPIWLDENGQEIADDNGKNDLTDYEYEPVWVVDENGKPVPKPFADTQKLEAAEKEVMFWERQSSAAKDRKEKWVYNKWKHYGVNGETLPEIPLMRGSEMLLIMAEALAEGATSADGYTATGLLNTLQEARGAQLTDGSVENILVERRKELLGEGVTGQFDLVRRQDELVRYCTTDEDMSGHYEYGCDEFPDWSGYGQEKVTMPSNDYRFFKQIPDAEFTYNSAISLADQNPFEGQ